MTACGSTGNSTADNTGTTDTATHETGITRSAFDGNAALELTRKQCEFGPRVPATPAHAKCADWLTETLKASCDTVIVQTGTEHHRHHQSRSQ